MRRDHAHRPRLHQPVPAVARSIAFCRRDTQSVRPQGSAGAGSGFVAREVLDLHLGSHCRALHWYNYGRLHFRIRPVLATVWREILAGQLAGSHQGFQRQRDFPRVYRPLGGLQWLELLDLGSQPAQSDRVRTPDDGDVHERRRDWSDSGSAVQLAIQPVLLRNPIHAWANPVHGYPGCAHLRLCGRGIQQS